MSDVLVFILDLSLSEDVVDLTEPDRFRGFRMEVQCVEEDSCGSGSRPSNGEPELTSEK
jgi:hypothetical protein